MQTGLVLVGGGARAAYQAGALKAVSEILGENSAASQSPYQIISGVSAGAINAGMLASHADDIPAAITKLYRIWNHLEMKDVIKGDAVSLSGIAFRWLRDLIFGGMLPERVASNFLLDATPLHSLIKNETDFAAIHRHIQEGRLSAFSVSATNYSTGSEIVFFDGNEKLKTWSRSNRLSFKTEIRLEHILASASIPFLFRPIWIDGFCYGDGSLRQGAPLSPSVHLGADRILAISVRHQRSQGLTERVNEVEPRQEISLAQIAGVVLNAAFFDGLDYDAERMQRINKTIGSLPEEIRKNNGLLMKKIPLLVLRPSRDLGQMASAHFKCFPRTLQYLMRGIGASEKKGSELLSYLAFEHTYCARLLELGYEDTWAQKDEVHQFFNAAPSVREIEIPKQNKMTWTQPLR